MDIERQFYNKGYRKDVIEAIRKIEPDFEEDWMVTHELTQYWENLENKQNNE